MVRTLETRKRDEGRRKIAAVALLSEQLGRYARASGGRYLLYGSVARGTMRHDSDVDLLIEFPAGAEAAA